MRGHGGHRSARRPERRSTFCAAARCDGQRLPAPAESPSGVASHASHRMSRRASIVEHHTPAAVHRVEHRASSAEHRIDSRCKDLCCMSTGRRPPRPCTAKAGGRPICFIGVFSRCMTWVLGRMATRGEFLVIPRWVIVMHSFFLEATSLHGESLK